MPNLWWVFCIFPVIIAALAGNADEPLEEVVPYEVGVFHPELGWTAKPSSRAASRRTGDKIEYIINKDGFREINNSGAKSDCGVVALGDSNTYGYGIDMQEHWLTRLREEIPDFMIYNLGVSGYGVAQELLRFRLHGARLKPKLVVAYVPHFSEDRHMHAYRFGEAKPFYTVGDTGELIVQTDHIKGDRSVFEKKLAIGWDVLTKGIKALFTDWETATTQMGIKIIKAMEADSKSIGAEFVLLAGWKELCEQSRVSHCLDVDEISNYQIITPSGENLLHVNAEGSKKMAAMLAAYIREKSLVSECVPKPEEYRR